MEEEKYKIALFDGINFGSRKFRRIEIILDQPEVKEFATDKPEKILNRIHNNAQIFTDDKLKGAKKLVSQLELIKEHISDFKLYNVYAKSELGKLPYKSGTNFTNLNSH